MSSPAQIVVAVLAALAGLIAALMVWQSLRSETPLRRGARGALAFLAAAAVAWWALHR